MSGILPVDRLADIQPIVVSGGRPKRAHRYTRRMLDVLAGHTRSPIWVVMDEDAARYEWAWDDYPVVTFTRKWAESYAKDHWIGPEPFRRGAFLGASPTREYACRVAEKRGAWAALILDDNIIRLDAFNGYPATTRGINRRGGMTFVADVLGAVTLATNSRMTGAKLSSVNPSGEPNLFARAGFPYSLYLERVDLPNREPYYGPIEEDILHALHYANRPDDATAALVYPVSYSKEHVISAGTGMRPAYMDHQRAAGLRIAAPEVVRAGVHSTHSNGRGQARVFHAMVPGALRTPLVIRDAELFEKARASVLELRDEVTPEILENNRTRTANRAARAASRESLSGFLRNGG